MTCADRDLIAANVGRGLDDSAQLINEKTIASPLDDTPHTGWRWQNGAFNGLPAMIRMDPNDAPTGEWNGGVSVTPADIIAFDAAFPGVCTPFCVADYNLSGTVTVQDIFDFLAAYFSGDSRADINQVSSVTVHDILDFLAAYFLGRP